MDIADETGQPGLRSLAHFLGASAIDALGDHEAAAGLTQFGFELGQQAGWPDAAQWYSARMWLHLAFEGQQEVASAVAAEACAQYPQVIAWQGAWSLCLAFSSQNQQLSRLLAGLPAVLPTIPVDLFWLTAHGCFATAHGFGFQGPAAATVAYPLLLPYRSLHVTWGVGYLGPVEGALALLARQMGANETAIAHHEAAALTIDNCEAARARALNGYQWARTLLSRNAPGDRRRAIEIAHATLDYCRLKGYATFVDKTEELLTTIV